MKAILALENGSIFKGEAFGYKGQCSGEVCFNTSMTGYQEILTDPSYSRQIVTMTYPEIGNYGVNSADFESKKIQVSGFIVKNCCENPSNWRNGIKAASPGDTPIFTLSEYLTKNKIPGIKGIDTRKLVRILRDQGSLNGVLICGDYSPEEAVKQAKAIPPMAGQDLATKITCGSSADWNEPEHNLVFSGLEKRELSPRIIAIDFGIKNNIMRKLTSMGARVTCIPATTSATDILALNPNGILLSNGPGDPQPIQYAIDTIKQLIGKVPIFGICLGHQLLSIALGCNTFKLKFGHRGANHPIKNLKTSEVAITSQNHGFAVSPQSVDESQIEVTHINLNDNTVAGIRHKKYPVFSVQYHPEASPGPRDSEYLFIQFMDNVIEHMEAVQ